MRRPASASSKARVTPIDLLRRFVRELQAEARDAGRAPRVQMQAGLLRFGAEDGVAAADIGHHGMRAARGVAQRHAVLFAGAAAIAIAGAGGEEAAEDAMLGVEDGQVLVGDGLDAFAADLRAPGRPPARRSDRSVGVRCAQAELRGIRRR